MDGLRAEAALLAGDAAMDTLGRYDVDLTALTDGGGRVRIEGTVANLLRKKEFDVLGSKTHLAVTTEQPVAAGPILALAGLKETLATLTVKQLDAKIEKLYPNRDYHRVMFGELLAAWEAEDA